MQAPTLMHVRKGVLCLVDLVDSTQAVITKAASESAPGKGEKLLCEAIDEVQTTFAWHGAEIKAFTGDGLLFFFPATPRPERLMTHLTAALMESQDALLFFDGEKPGLALRASVHAGTLWETVSPGNHTEALGYDVLVAKDYCEAAENWGLTRALGATVVVSRQTLDRYPFWSDRKPVPRRKPMEYAPATEPFFLISFPKTGMMHRFGDADQAETENENLGEPSKERPESKAKSSKALNRKFAKRHGLILFLNIVPLRCTRSWPGLLAYIRAVDALREFVVAAGGSVVNSFGGTVVGYLPVPCSYRASLGQLFKCFSCEAGQPLGQFFDVCSAADWDVGLACGLACGTFFELLGGLSAGHVVGLTVVLAQRILMAGEAYCQLGGIPAFDREKSRCFLAVPHLEGEMSATTPGRKGAGSIQERLEVLLGSDDAGGVKALKRLTAAADKAYVADKTQEKPIVVEEKFLAGEEVGKIKSLGSGGFAMPKVRVWRLRTP